MGKTKQADPKEIAEKGVALFYLAEKGGETMGTNLFKKRILYAGRFVHPRDPEKWLTITPEHFSKAIENFRANAMDRVNVFFTHNEDPRNLAGKVVDLVEGIDGTDGKPSLYAVIETKDKAASELVEKNAIGVSAGIDHFYREHLGGKDLGMVVKHVALVGEGWIKKLGDFIPVPSMRTAATALSEHEGGVIYFEEDKQEKTEGETEEQKLKREEDEQKTKAKLEEGDTMPTRDELMKQAKELGLVVMAEADHKTLVTKAAQRDRIQETFKDSLHFADSDDVAQKIIDEINSRDMAIKTSEGERVFAALLGEKKVLPAQKDSLVRLYIKDKDLFTQFTQTLQAGSNGVVLGEEGKSSGTETNGDMNDATKVQNSIKEGLIAAHRAGIHLSEENLELIGVKN